jgi:hypothetical protein
MNTVTSELSFIATLLMASSGVLGFTSGPSRFLHTSSTPIISTRLCASVGGWGSQKLGQSVISQNTTEVIIDHATLLRLRPTIGSGEDERGVRSSSSVDFFESEENVEATLTRIEKSYKQRSLLMSLKNPKISNFDKLEAVRNAVRVDGLLNIPLMTTNEVRTVNIKSGSLMNDWNLTF